MILRSFIFLFLTILIVINNKNLLILLLLLELLGFILVYFLRVYCSLFSDFLVLILFSVLVIEGVIGLSGLISLVTFSGSDYICSSTLSKC